MERNGKPMRVWRLLGLVDWWWLILFGGLEFWASLALHVPGWVPSLSSLWIFVQAAWLKRAEPSSRAAYLYAVWMAINLVSATPAFARVPQPAQSGIEFIDAAVWLSGIFVFRHEMRHHFRLVDPRGLELSGVMTFFFSTLYFQYWFREIYKQQTEPSLSLTPS